MIQEDKLKNRKELAQTYLIITTLLITIKQVTVKQNNSTENPILYLFLALFIIGTLTIYILPTFAKIYAVLFGISFSAITYFCLFEQIIATDVDIKYLSEYLSTPFTLMIVSEIAFGIVMYSKIKYKRGDYQFHFSTLEMGFRCKNNYSVL